MLHRVDKRTQMKQPTFTVSNVKIINTAFHDFLSNYYTILHNIFHTFDPEYAGSYGNQHGYESSQQTPAAHQSSTPATPAYVGMPDYQHDQPGPYIGGQQYNQQFDEQSQPPATPQYQTPSHQPPQTPQALQASREQQGYEESVIKLCIQVTHHSISRMGTEVMRAKWKINLRSIRAADMR
ncbi:unnamed protein product, partial [Meganyctiphanes norvegica]